MKPKSSNCLEAYHKLNPNMALILSDRNRSFVERNINPESATSKFFFPP